MHIPAMLAMSGYGWYVWSAFLLVTTGLLLFYFSARIRLAKIKRRYQQYQAELAKNKPK